jgi:hypothetical protein
LQPGGPRRQLGCDGGEGIQPHRLIPREKRAVVSATAQRSR